MRRYRIPPTHLVPPSMLCTSSALIMMHDAARARTRHHFRLSSASISVLDRFVPCLMLKLRCNTTNAVSVMTRVMRGTCTLALQSARRTTRISNANVRMRVCQLGADEAFVRVLDRCADGSNLVRYGETMVHISSKCRYRDGLRKWPG